MIPPFLLYVRPPKSRVGCWFPLILLWPVLVFVAIVGTVVGLLMALPYLGTSRARRYALLTPAWWRVVCALRGLRVDVRDETGGIGLAVK